LRGTQSSVTSGHEVYSNNIIAGLGPVTVTELSKNSLKCS